MSQTIILKNSNAQGNVPELGELTLGELAINTYDGKLFLNKNNSQIIAIGADATTLNGQSASYYLNYDNFTNTPTVDSVITDGSTNAVESNAVFDALALKQDDLGFTPEDSANKGVANGYASLGADAKIPTSQLPALAITSSYVVADETAQLALTVQEGDVAIRTDENKTYIHNGGSAGTMADWSEMLTPTDVVLSVNGQTGAITLTTTDISEGTNLYYTDARVLSYVGGVLNDSGTGTSDFWSASKIVSHVSDEILAVKAVNYTVDPTATDDNNTGMYVGRVWVNTATDNTFICVDNTTDAAVWMDLSTTTGTITGASNIGNAGVGVYDSTLGGAVLQFRNIAPGSSRVTTTLDGNNNILVDVVINDSGTGTGDLWSASKIVSRTIDGGTF